VKVRVLGCCGWSSVAGFGLALEWWVWLGSARGALSIDGIFRRIGSVLRFDVLFKPSLIDSRCLGNFISPEFKEKHQILYRNKAKNYILYVFDD